MLVRLSGISFVAALAVAQAPPGFKTYENKQAPLQFFYPAAYDELPLPPTEQVNVARFVLKQWPEDVKKIAERYRLPMAELSVFLFRAETAVTGAAPKDEPKGPGTVREAMESGSRVHSWTEFVARFQAWTLTEVAKKPGHFTMSVSGQSGEVRQVGYLVRRDEGNATFGVCGLSFTPHQKALEAQVVKMAASLAIADDDAGEMAAEAIDRLYANGKFRAVEARKKARSEMPKGWKAVDTENFLIVHHSKNEGLIRRIAREIEAMRSLYAQHFPAVAPVDALSIVRVCRTKEEYHQYGGPPTSGGYWHPGNEELVFFDYSYTMKTLDDDQRKAMNGRVLTSDDSLLVLYHEALHQYLHYAVGEFGPHDWFNEGYGDYYSGAVVNDAATSVLRIDPSPWRIHLAKDMCEWGEGYVPLDRLLRAERGEFYNPARAGHYYAAAWSFVYFLKQSKEAAAVPAWAGLLQKYFDTVKKAYADELQLAKDTGVPIDLEQKTKASMIARRTALTKTLEGIDIPKLEAAWRKYVIDMRDPWPSKRKPHK